MQAMNPLAQELNATLEADSPTVFSLLSERGKNIFFPKAGILGQTAEAKGSRYNATIGIALEEDGSPMRLPFLEEQLSLDPKDAYPYAPSYGKKELREQWQTMIFQKNPTLKGRVSLPVVTNALTHGASMIAYLFVDPGDEIILPDKFWGNYKIMFQTTYDAVFNTFNTFTDDGFDLESFEQTLNERTGKKIVLLNFPNNPTGYTATEKEAEAITKILLKRAEAGDELVVILDDAYFGLVYEKGVYRESLFAQLAHLHERILAVKLDGATKEDYVWGFRVGFVTYSCKGITEGVCSALEDKTAGAVRATISNTPHLSQSLLLKLYQSTRYKQEKQEKYDLLKKRYQRVKSVLRHPEYKEMFTALPFNSGYFLSIQIRDDLNAEEVRRKLLEDFDTGVIATGNLIRIAYSSLPIDDIDPLFKNIFAACKELIPTPTPALV